MDVFHLFSPINTSLWWSESFDIELFRAALIRIGRKGISYSHKLYPPFSADWFCPVILSFTSCLVQHLGYLLFLDYHMCPIWTHLGLARFLCNGCIMGTCFDHEESPFDYPIFLMFLEGALKWSKELEGAVCTTWYWGSVLILLEVFILSLVCHLHLDAIGWRRSCGIILISWLLSDIKGSDSFGRNASRL